MQFGFGGDAFRAFLGEGGLVSIFFSLGAVEVGITALGFNLSFSQTLLVLLSLHRSGYGYNGNNHYYNDHGDQDGRHLFLSFGRSPQHEVPLCRGSNRQTDFGGLSVYPQSARGTSTGMNFGFSLFLIAVGAILAFAVNARVSGIDLDVVGYILMAVGAVGLVYSVFAYNRRGRVVAEVPPRDLPPRY